MIRIFLSSLLLTLSLQAGLLQISPQLGSAGVITSSTYDPTAAQSGVAMVTFSTGVLCSGVAIAPTVVLTAAHCIGSAVSGNATFNNAGVNESFAVSSFLVHPTWAGNALDHVDLALVYLTSPLAAWVSLYELYNNTDEVGQNYLAAGWGVQASGGAAQGSTAGAGTLRIGNNVWDSTFAFYRPLRTDLLISDFDGPAGNGVAREVTLAPGDSGGPGFLGSRVAGIASFIAAPTTPTGAFGDLNGYTRVSSHLAWINTNAGTTQVPEPATFGLVGFAVYCLWARRRAAAIS